MKYKSLIFSCLIAGTGMLSPQAIAGGSIGGDCCADLEERVAELEATTVRKGNRKVTLTISGSISRGILISEPGSFNDYAKDVMITDAYSAPQSNIALYGLAALNRSTYVGYSLILRVSDGGTLNDGFQQDQALEIYNNDLLIGSRTYGNLYIGYGNTASDLAAEQDLSGTNYLAGGSTAHYNIGGNLDGFEVQERVRYESPSLAGFKMSASWQENNNWDASLAYSGKLGDFKVKAKIAYFELGEDTASFWGAHSSKGDSGVSGSVSVLHNPTGISLTYAKGEVDSAAVTDSFNYTLAFNYFKAGIQRKLIGAGKTYISADYHETETIFGDVEKIGVQLVQDIDAASMQLFVSYWNAEQKSSVLFGPTNLGEEALMIGAKLNF